MLYRGVVSGVDVVSCRREVDPDPILVPLVLEVSEESTGSVQCQLRYTGHSSRTLHTDFMFFRPVPPRTLGS